MLRNALGGLLPSTSRSVISEKLESTQRLVTLTWPIMAREEGDDKSRRQKETKENTHVGAKNHPLRSLETQVCADCSAARNASMCMESVHAAVDELRGAQWVLAWLQYLRLARIAIVFLRGHSGVSHLCRRQSSQKKQDLRELESAKGCTTGPL